MGVRGLHRYIESNSDFLKTCNFRQSKLIIDGSSLFYQLYFGSDLDKTHGGDYNDFDKNEKSYFRSDLDKTHGGDYNDFEKNVRLFFKNLNLCNIEPYVVLDGGHDIRDKKFDTMKKRCQQSIINAHFLSRGHLDGYILPILIKNVFKQVLRKLGIPFIQCLAEADWEAAALASEWNWPVLSNDSDFYIFCNRGGFLPINHFQWWKVSPRSLAKKFIPAKWFGFKKLCAVYNHMNKDLLPLFATILGNDYVTLHKSTFPNFSNFSNFSTKPGKNAYIDGLLMWLSCFRGPKEAIAALLNPMGKTEESKNLRTTIKQEMEVYRLKPSSIAQFFTSREPQTRLPGLLQNLPSWTLKPLAEGKLASNVIAVLTEQRVIINFQVEDFELSTSSKTSQCIRQVTYGILLCTRWQNVSKHSTSGAKKEEYVEEYDRLKVKLKSFKVPAVLPKCLATLQLDSVWELPQHLRLQVLLDALEVSLVTDLTHVPEGLQLAVYVTCFWLKHAEPKPKAETFWALLTSLVYGHLCREQQTEKETGPEGLGFKKLHRHKRKKTLDLELAHAYCQWQCCLKDSFNLNQLLNHPVTEPELAWLYCGSFLHGVAHELKSGTEPESVLADAPEAISLYKNLQVSVEKQLDDDFITRLRTRTWSREHQESVDELSKAFEHPLDEVEEEDENQKIIMDDKVLEETCRIRTRHKTKRRNPKSKSKKRDRVSWQ